MKAQAKWKVMCAGDTVGTPLNWEGIYRSPFIATSDTKLQSFQYKISHNVFATNEFLFKCGIRLNADCDWCGEKDTLKHFLLYCPRSKALLLNIDKWLRNVYYVNNTIELTEGEFLLGKVTGSRTNQVILNTVFMFTKFFIQRQKRYGKGDCSFVLWLLEFKNKLTVDKMASEKYNHPQRFQCWSTIYESM